MKVAFVTNLCAHYNVGTFEALARAHDVDFLFFSPGDEWYWPRAHGYRQGNFRSKNFPGFAFRGTRVSFSLIWQLARGNYDVYIKCINGRFALPMTYIMARLRRKPFILWTGIWTRLQTPGQRLIFPFARYIYRHADAIVVYGEHVKRYLVSEGVPPGRIWVAPHATDNVFYGRTMARSDQESLRVRLEVAASQKIVLYLGRLEESKGVEFLLRAFAQVGRSDAVLVIAGTGSLEAGFRMLASDLGIAANIRFCGYVPIESAPLYHSLAWVFVLPSVTTRAGREPWGLVVNEAFSQGVPVVASDAVGAAAGGLVRDGFNGAVVPERDVNALATALGRLLEDPYLREVWGRNGRQTVAQWDYHRNVQGYLRAIDYVFSPRQSAAGPRKR